MKYNKLTPQEIEVIENKGTEMPFSGKFNSFYKDGVYICKKCNSPLFKSNDKFDSGSGWPSCKLLAKPLFQKRGFYRFKKD